MNEPSYFTGIDFATEPDRTICTTVRRDSRGRYHIVGFGEVEGDRVWHDANPDRGSPCHWHELRDDGSLGPPRLG